MCVDDSLNKSLLVYPCVGVTSYLLGTLLSGSADSFWSPSFSVVLKAFPLRSAVTQDSLTRSGESDSELNSTAKCGVCGV